MTRIEKEILNKYIDSYINGLHMSPREAKKIAKDNFIDSKKTAIEEGVYDLPPYYWKEIFIMEEKGIDNACTKYYKKAREDGVKNEDIINYWETYPVERYMIQTTQNMINMNVMITALDQGKTQREATRIVRRKFPTYGNPFVKHEYGTEEDNALPGELMLKVQKLQRLYKNPDELDKLDNFNSFNAYIRSLARADKL